MPRRVPHGFIRPAGSGKHDAPERGLSGWTDDLLKFSSASAECTHVRPAPASHVDPSRRRARFAAVLGVVVGCTLIWGSLAALNRFVLGFHAWPTPERPSAQRLVVPTHRRSSPSHRSGERVAFAGGLAAPAASLLPGGTVGSTARGWRRHVERRRHRDTRWSHRPVVRLADRRPGRRARPRRHQHPGRPPPDDPSDDHDRADHADVSLTPTPTATDTDGDGIPDSYEISHGLNPNNPADGAATPNGDGVTNAERYRRQVAANQKAGTTDKGTTPVDTPVTDPTATPTDPVPAPDPAPAPDPHARPVAAARRDARPRRPGRPAADGSRDPPDGSRDPAGARPAHRRRRSARRAAGPARRSAGRPGPARGHVHAAGRSRRAGHRRRDDRRPPASRSLRPHTIRTMRIGIITGSGTYALPGLEHLDERPGGDDVRRRARDARTPRRRGDPPREPPRPGASPRLPPGRAPCEHRRAA